MSGARVIATKHPGCVLVSINGSIDESFDLELINIASDVVVFDMQGITRITSFGVMQWMKALASLRASYYGFVRCRPNVIDQFNMVRGFGGRGEVISFYAPYECAECGNTFDELIDLRNDFDSLPELQQRTIPCPRCKAGAELDAIPELYLQHITLSPRPRPPAEAIAAIDGGTGLATHRLTVHKEVTESITSFRISGFLDRRGYFRRLSDGVEGVVVLDLSEMTGAAPDGLAGLAGFIDGINDVTYFARVPVAMVSHLAALGEASESPRFAVVSVRIPFRCDRCSRNTPVDCPVDQPRTFASSQIDTVHICPKCGGSLLSNPAPQLLREIAQLPTAAVPPALHSYLGHPTDLGSVGVGAGPGESIALVSEPLLGKYHLVKRFGEGTIGETFLARHRGPQGFEKLVVLKRIRRSNLNDPDANELFVREARIAAKLSHPNIVQIFDLEQLGDEYFIVMEYVNGIDLSRALAASRAARVHWPINICCMLVAELCAALHAAHSFVDAAGRAFPIIHRDVQPGNVLLSADGSVKLADFGIAKVLGDGVNQITTKDIRYSAPELRAPSDWPTDARVDIYSAGVILFETLTLRPFAPPEENPVRRKGPPNILVWRSGVPPVLQSIFEKAIRQTPHDRYTEAVDFERDLHKLLKVVPGSSKESFAAWIRQVMELPQPPAESIPVGS